MLHAIVMLLSMLSPKKDACCACPPTPLCPDAPCCAVEK